MAFKTRHKLLSVRNKPWFATVEKSKLCPNHQHDGNHSIGSLLYIKTSSMYFYSDQTNTKKQFDKSPRCVFPGSLFGRHRVIDVIANCSNGNYSMGHIPYRHRPCSRTAFWFCIGADKWLHLRYNRSRKTRYDAAVMVISENRLFNDARIGGRGDT